MILIDSEPGTSTEGRLGAETYVRRRSGRPRELAAAMRFATPYPREGP